MRQDQRTADIAVPDNSTAFSDITIAGCNRNASATAKVTVDIRHTYKGDLVVEVIAPDGTPYVLHNRAGGSADNIQQTFTVNLSSEPANGLWRLRVRDAAVGRHRRHQPLDARALDHRGEGRPLLTDEERAAHAVNPPRP